MNDQHATRGGSTNHAGDVEAASDIADTGNAAGGTGAAVNAEASTANLAAMASLMREQRAAARRPEARAIVSMMIVWGAAWLVGFLALWSGTNGGNPWFRLPSPVEWIVFFGVLALGAVLSGVIGSRMARGMRGDSARAGAMFGWAWPVGMLGAWGVLSAMIGHGLDREQISLLAPALFVMMAGLIYLVGAAQWRSVGSFVFGVALILLAVAATLLGAPHHYLAYALGGATIFGLFAPFTWRELMRDDATEPSRARTPSPATPAAPPTSPAAPRKPPTSPER